MENLKVIESELVPVYETDKGIKVVYGTELFRCLGSKRQYTDWIKERLSECDAEENKDFQSFSQKNEKGGRPKKEYIIQLTTAKEMAMLERNDKGKQVRRYFIAVEEKFKEAVKAPKSHSVKPLTITSRDVCAMTGRRVKYHAATVQVIQNCIEELEGMGFDRQDFFIDSSYRGANNNEKPYPQFLCTRKGCEYYANKLEAQYRDTFLSEVNARFDQMQDIIDGKPTHLKRQAVADRGAFVGLYSYNDHGILIVENDVYLLDEKQTDMFSVLIPELQFRNVCQIKEVISSLLESVEKAEKMEAIFETKIENPNADEESQKMLPDNLEKSNKEIEVPLDQVANLNKKQARARYGIGEQYLIEIADEIGATVRIGRRRFFDRKKMDAHFERIAE